MRERKDANIQAPYGKVHAEELAPTIEAMKEELKAIIKVNKKLFALMVVFIVLANLLPLFLQGIFGIALKILVEIAVISLGIHYITIRVIKIINISAKGSGEGSGKAKANTAPK